MHLVRVIPIARGITKDILTYFSGEKAEPGMIVFVPLRNRTVPALVVETENPRTAKAQLKAADFAIRKTTRKKAVPFLPPEFVRAAAETAFFHASATGAVLHAMIPQTILENIEKHKADCSSPLKPEENDVQGERVIFQAEAKERLSRYRSIIRESFARNSSVFIVVPTIVEAEYFNTELSRGIASYTFCFHSGLTKKETGSRWNRAQEEGHPVLIIGTAPFISLFRNDLKTIIIEREKSRSYKLISRPFLDLRLFIENYARMRRTRLILSDLPLRIETLWRHREGELQDVMPPKLRLLASAEETLIDMREEKKRPEETFPILSERLRDIIKNTVAQGERCFLFTSRRGLAPITVCKDCGGVVMSKDGTSPMVLHKTNKGNAFLSHATGEIRDAHERCLSCKSWRLEALGIGIERAYDAVEELIPNSKIFRVDKDATKTYRQVQSEIEKFYETAGTVLLGTELAIPHLTTPIEHGAVISADSFLSLPEWRITERVFSFMLAIREISQISFTIQTRKVGAQVLGNALTGNIGDFYRSEIALREQFNYPPFSVLVKISVQGTPARVAKEMEKVKELFADFGIRVYPASLQLSRNVHELHALMRVPRKEWPNTAIIERLRSLPPHITVNIDPENLL